MYTPPEGWSVSPSGEYALVTERLQSTLDKRTDLALRDRAGIVLKAAPNL